MNTIGMTIGIALLLLACALLFALPRWQKTQHLIKLPRGLTALVFMDNPTTEKIRELRDKLLELNERAQVLQATADAENRALTEDEEKEVEGIFAEFDRINEEIERREMIANQAARLRTSNGRQTEAQAADANLQAQAVEEPARMVRPRTVTAGARPRVQPVFEDRGKWGWKHMGDFALAVRIAAAKGGEIDPRLVMNAPTTFSSEGTGADGGFAVPPEFRTAIWEKVQGEDSLLSRTDQNPTTKNTMVLPADETTPWDSSGGIQAYFESEAGQLTQSKVALKDKTIRLNKRTALVPVTDELLEDAPGLDAYLRKKVGEKFDFKLNLKIIQGAGAGEPWGILGHPSVISVAKESGQAADTVVAANIDNMWSRLYAPCRRNAVWLVNQDIEPQLQKLQFSVLNSSGAVVGGVPLYMPPNGLSDSPYATIKGRPVIPTQACETLGDKGDIILADLTKYMTAFKTGGIKADVSMHLWFDYDVMAYRFILRIAGQPWWATYITPRDGTNYLSWAVTLDERAG